jgi:hypothetical protein
MRVFQHPETHRYMDNWGFTLKQCGKCSGLGSLPGYEFSDNAKCWRCNGNGYYHTPKVLVARQQFVADVKAEARAAKDEGRSPSTPNFQHYWDLGGVKIEPDISARILGNYNPSPGTGSASS